MSPRKKVEAKDWVDALLAVLDEDRTPPETSIDDLAKIIEVAKKTGVTKGAFYPHFPNIAALREAAIAEWLRDQLAAMPYTAVSSDGAVRDPLDRIRKIREELAVRGTRNGAMRRWAASDAAAANAVALADRVVISHLEHALADLGFTVRRAAAHAVHLSAALRSQDVVADQESFDLVLEDLAHAAAYASERPVVRSSENAAGAVVLYTTPGGMTREHLQVLQRVADALAAGQRAEPPDGQDAGPGGQEQEHAGQS